jgi:nucleoside-diphosphate-sugar epimerase
LSQSDATADLSQIVAPSCQTCVGNEQEKAMRIFFTGATGVVGRRAVPQLIRAGHQVTAVVRSDNDAAWATEIGAIPAAVDLFDRGAVSEAVSGHDGVIHFATAIPPQAKMTKRRSWRANDRLRTEATANLVDSALRHDAHTFVQESVTFSYADGSDRWLDEDSPIEPVWDSLDSALEAEREVGRFSTGSRRGVILRLSRLYGPGRTSAELMDAVAARKLPIVGTGDNLVSHLHVDDAASAIIAALDSPAGTYNVSDDEPVSSAEDLGLLASALAAPPPRRVPAWVAKALAGSAAGLLTVSHRVSNRRFRDVTGWAPVHPSVATGWSSVIAGHQRAA